MPESVESMAVSNVQSMKAPFGEGSACSRGAVRPPPGWPSGRGMRTWPMHRPWHHRARRSATGADSAAAGASAHRRRWRGCRRSSACEHGSGMRRARASSAGTSPRPGGHCRSRSGEQGPRGWRRVPAAAVRLRVPARVGRWDRVPAAASGPGRDSAALAWALWRVRRVVSGHERNISSAPHRRGRSSGPRRARCWRAPARYGRR